jgi:putative PIN family toxin of toxin-antitoxin system
MNMNRFVLDTNVIVSALLLKDSKPAAAFDAAFRKGVVLVSIPVLEEISEVLSRSRFDPYIFREERERFLMAFIREAELVDIRQNVRICRDPWDDKFLELALNGKATCIISGDKDLLSIKKFEGIQIVTPDEFLK